MDACFAGIVEFPEELGGGPVVGAAVTLRSREIYGAGGLAGSYTIEVVTQAGTIEGGEPADRGCSPTALPAGGFAVSVLPGLYDVEIRPIDAQLGVHVEQREIVRDLLGHVLQLPPRPLLRGVVMRSSDEPVMDARVRALPLQTPLPGIAGSDVSLLNRPNETLTDPVGNFQLPLDVGVYDLVAEPPVGSGFPWVVRPAFAMSARAWTEPLDVRDPVAIRGSAHFDTGGAAAVAQVTAYAMVTGENGETRPVAIGRATTDAAGAFLLLLPPDVRTR
jgi:hypothetical protein